MYTLESTLARLKIEDRIREANQPRLAHEFHRRELPSTTPTAVWEPGARGPSDIAPADQVPARSRVVAHWPLRLHTRNHPRVSLRSARPAHTGAPRPPGSTGTRFKPRSRGVRTGNPMPMRSSLSHAFLLGLGICLLLTSCSTTSKENQDRDEIQPLTRAQAETVLLTPHNLGPLYRQVAPQRRRHQ